MREIAVAAEVSSTTVSFILNERQEALRFSEDTRRRVLETAERLGYSRNAMARSVATGKSRMLGFLTTQPSCESSARLLVGALDEATEAGYTLKLLRTNRKDIAPSIAKCLELRLDGIIDVDNKVEQLYSAMSRHGIPYSILEGQTPHSDMSHILADEAQGCRLALEHLYGHGHRSIGYVAGYHLVGNVTNLTAIRLRHFCDQMATMGLEVAEDHIVFGNFSPDVTATVTRQLLQAKGGPPTGILCVSDETAIVVCRTLRAEGFRVPEDISVIGCCDLALVGLFDPPLTTIALPFEKMGRMAARRLLERIENRISPESTTFETIPTTLIIRGSSGPVPI